MAKSMDNSSTWKAGLEDVVATRSAICTVDGEGGRLFYRGYEIADLARGTSFEDVTYLLWFGELPDAAQSAEHRRRLAETRGLPKEIKALLEGLPHDTHPLDALRTAVSLAAAYDLDTRTSDRDANIRKGYRLMNLVPETVAAWQRIRTGRAPVDPTSGGGVGVLSGGAPTFNDSGHAARFLHLLDGQVPSPEVAHVLDVALILHADHELNASTFAARIAVATLADMHAALTAAVATLKGPRHGGANEDVLAMLLGIGDPEKAEAYVESRIGKRGTLSKAERADPKARMPGFGHRVYKVDDARARVLRVMAKSMAEATGKTRLFAVAEGVYDAMHARTSLPVNVDFFSAVVYDALGIPPDFCTSIFAVGRVAGWVAHVLEQYADNRLIRPRAEWVGSAPRTLSATGR
jgi:citrate synthase